MPQPNGRGALLSGGMPGNAGGLGRPRSTIRDMLAGSYEQRVPILEAIADGEAIDRAEIPLTTVLAHASCPVCNGKFESRHDLVETLIVRMEAKVSAKPKDRLSALDQMGKYGGIAPKEMAVDEVRKRLRLTVDAVERTLSSVDAARVLAAIRPAWSLGT